MQFARTHSLAIATLAAATCFVPGCASDQHDDGPAPPVVSEAEMMARMMELGSPGPQHKEFEKLTGSWELSYKTRWSPDAPWTDSTGTSEAKLVLGGRYLVEEIQFSMMGLAIQGLHILGYDNMHQEYISFWADTMGTWWITAHGTADENGVIELKGTMVDVAGTRPFRMILRHLADGSRETEMYDTIPPHGEVKVMTVSSKKRK